MTILHYIERQATNADITDKYMPALFQCMSGTAANSIASSLKEMKDIATKKRPDIVHIHSCWSYSAWRAERWCNRHRIPVVLSPHRQLEPWHLAHHYWLAKLPMMIIFQKGIIKRAKAIQATTKQEQNNLLLLDYHPLIKSRDPWNKRVATVKNSLTDGSITDRQMAFDMYALYQKVIDSYPFLVMDDKEKAAENALLRRGMAQDNVSALLRSESIDNINSLSSASWRKIFLHCNDEGVIDELNRGIRELGLNVQAADTATIKRFDKEKKKDLSPLRSDKAAKKQLRLEEIADEEKASPEETRICTMFINLRQQMTHGTLSKRHIADLYTAIRFTDYDEDKAGRILGRLNMKEFSGRMLQIMQETLGLEEGFTPFRTINDRKTNKIRNILQKADIQ